MRAISDVLFFSFLPLYWMLSILAWKTVRQLLRDFLKLKHKPVFFGLMVLTCFQSFAFIVLFRLVPVQFTLHHYNLYFHFNAFLTLDVIIRALLSMCLLLFHVPPLKRHRTTISLVSVILSAGILLSFFWGIFFGINRLERRDLFLDFANLPSRFDGFRIVQFSDTHFGSFRGTRMLTRMAALSNEFNPNIVVFTGDLVNHHAEEAGEWMGMLNSFRAAEGKFAVRGNHDYGDYATWDSPEAKEANFVWLKEALAISGFRLIENGSVKITHGNDTIYVVGTGNMGTPPFPRYADLEKAGAGIPSSAFRILLSHDPSCWESDATSGYSLCLAGHTHGFQWGIRLAGIPLCLLNVFMKYSCGLYSSEGRYLYVNRGTGYIGLALRLDMPAEITCITLRKR